VQTDTGEENSFELCNLKKSPLRDLHRVVEHLGGKAVGGNTVADRSFEEFCEALPSGHRASARSAQR